MRTCTGKTQLFFREMAQIVDSCRLSVVVLTDDASRRAMNIICDEAMTQQLLIRIHHLPGEDIMLPEALTQMLIVHGPYSKQDYELLVYGVREGQYLVELTCLPTGVSVPIRISDAVLLSLTADISLYIDQMLFLRQSAEYVPHTSGLIIPINTFSLEQLNEELQKAIADENYRLASSLHEEIKKRTKQ